MTNVYPLCIFLNSHTHGRLPVDHHFHQFVKDNLEHVIESPLILHYIAKNTFQKESLLNTNNSADLEKKRIQEIIQYLQTNHPTVSASDSPTMHLSRSSYVQIETRSYSDCGKSHKSRKLARKHIYINKKFVDIWMMLYYESKLDASSYTSFGPYLLHSFLLKLCLLHGLIIAVKTAFMSEDTTSTSMEVIVHNTSTRSLSSSLTPGSPCSFEKFLWEWNVWIRVFTCGSDIRLTNIIFKARLCHVTIIKYMDTKLNAQALLRFYAGDWTAFPPVHDIPYMKFNQGYYILHQIWDAPPVEDPQPHKIEMVQWIERSNNCCIV